MGRKRNHRHKFEVIRRDCGHGARSKVSVIKRKSDGKLFIRKQPLLDDEWHHESLQKEIKYAKFWRKFGASNVKVCWYHDRRSLLKTYVKGDTLQKILKNDQGFFSGNSRPLKALRNLTGFLVNSKYYIYDLIGENLVFDGKRWHIIDSGSVVYIGNRTETKKRYKEKFLKYWSKMLLSDQDVGSLKLFLGSIKSLRYRK
jgi:tRNA A-37 threonylcarbamoyl transferase component Bud32